MEATSKTATRRPTRRGPTSRTRTLQEDGSRSLGPARLSRELGHAWVTWWHGSRRRTTRVHLAGEPHPQDDGLAPRATAVVTPTPHRSALRRHLSPRAVIAATPAGQPGALKRPPESGPL